MLCRNHLIEPKRISVSDLPKRITAGQKIMERNTLKICDIVTMSMEEMSGGSTYAGSLINLDAFTIDNHLGKTPLGGLVYGGEGLIEHGGRSILDTIRNAIRIMENSPG